MERHARLMGIAVFVAVTYVLMVAVNGLANALPINGMITGDISDAYPNLFAPAGETFTIWGVIYLLLLGHVLYRLGLLGGKSTLASEDLLRYTGVVFGISSIANAAWIFAWHYQQIALSLVLMLVILVCLILINRRRASAGLTGRDNTWLRVPFSVYFGWITVATVANVTTLLVDLGWNGFGLSEPAWMIIILIVAAAIAIATMLRNRDFFYGLVPVWAYLGILLKHLTIFEGAYPAVIGVDIACIVAFLVTLGYVVGRGRKQIPAGMWV